MENLNEYIKEYKELLKEENSILKTIRDKKIAYEKEAKKDKQKLDKLRLTKKKLSNKSVKKKIISVCIGDLIKELAKLTNSSVNNIKLEVETGAVYMGYKKKTMKQMLDCINEEKDEDLLTIRIKDNTCENPYHFLLSSKLDIFATLANKEKLAKYFYLEKEKCNYVTEGFDVYTTLCIKEKVWDKIIYNLSLEELFLEENQFLQKAVLNCVNKKDEEKVK